MSAITFDWTGRFCQLTLLTRCIWVISRLRRSLSFRWHCFSPHSGEFTLRQFKTKAPTKFADALENIIKIVAMTTWRISLLFQTKAIDNVFIIGQSMHAQPFAVDAISANWTRLRLFESQSKRHALERVHRNWCLKINRWKFFVLFFFFFNQFVPSLRWLGRRKNDVNRLTDFVIDFSEKFCRTIKHVGSSKSAPALTPASSTSLIWTNDVRIDEPNLLNNWVRLKRFDKIHWTEPFWVTLSLTVHPLQTQ